MPLPSRITEARRLMSVIRPRIALRLLQVARLEGALDEDHQPADEVLEQGPRAEADADGLS
jgi:hypothetical protein